MKKFSILAVMILIVILTTCLVGCDFGDPIDFTMEELVLHGDTEMNEHSETAKKIDSREELLSYMNFSSNFNMELIKKFDDSYFEENSLIILTHYVYDDETYEVKDVKVKDTKLTVKLSRKYVEGFFTQIYYDFIRVNKNDVENVTQCSVVTSSTSISFGF